MWALRADALAPAPVVEIVDLLKALRDRDRDPSHGHGQQPCCHGTMDPPTPGDLPSLQWQQCCQGGLQWQGALELMRSPLHSGRKPLCYNICCLNAGHDKV